MNRDTSSPALAIPTRVRYGVLAFACALSMVTYLDRLCIGMASQSLRTVLGLGSVADMKWAFTAFSLAYAIFEVPTGWLGDVFGPRSTLIRIVLWWSIFTALTGLTGWQVGGVTLIGFVALVVIRFLFGIGEAGAYPNITRALHNWFPLGERARTQGAVWMSGRFMGGLTPLVWLLLVTGVGLSWRVPFFIFGGIGVCWCLLFSTWFRNRPEEHAATNEAERKLIAEGSGHATASAHANVPWLKLILSRNLWVLCLMYFCSSYSWYFNVNYLPEYLQEQHGIQQTKQDDAQKKEQPTIQMEDVLFALYKGGPLLFGAVGCILGGFLSDWFIRRTGNHRWGRRLLGIGGQTACVACYLTCLVAPSAWLFALAIALSGFFNDLAMGSSWATCQDIGKRYAAIVAGCMNTIGNLGGALSAFFIGTILDFFLERNLATQGLGIQAVKEAAKNHDAAAEQLLRVGNMQGYQVNFLMFAAICAITVFLWLGIDATKPVVDEPPTPQDEEGKSDAVPPE
jgi:ACS family glucarate transporter-like MFS transporter